MHAVFATFLALRARAAAGGEGSLVESVMVEAALNAAVEAVLEHDATGEVLGRDGNRSALAAPQGLYRCAGTDRWVALAVVDDEQWHALARVLGKPPWMDEPAFADAAGRRAHHDRVDAALSGGVAGQDAAGAAEALAAAGVPAEVVIAGRDIAHNPQLRHRGLFEIEDHPLTGRHELPTLPFRMSGVECWLHRPSPTLGQHDDEVLGEVLGAAELAALRDRGVVGDRVRRS
jgi:crotonobetainyl-CoA:carnitine CoA-transferase CaiB-like acyl-CoA transferase